MAERGKPVELLPGGQSIVRKTYGSAGKGCSRKQMPLCNEVDTGLNVTRHENEPTSSRSSMVRELGESTL